MPLLGVNIDHVATVREARKTNEPDPVWAATLAELGGADAITVHLREDRRHIQERDLRVLVESVAVPINLELACAEDVLAIACEARPYQATLVPERREEVTTEGGLDVVGGRKRVAEAVKRLKDAGIMVSLFLDPDEAQIGGRSGTGRRRDRAAHRRVRPCVGEARRRAGTGHAHEGRQANPRRRAFCLHAGHGLTYRNVKPVAAIADMRELNIGHSIIARAIMVGLEQAVRDMKRLIA